MSSAAGSVHSYHKADDAPLESLRDVVEDAVDERRVDLADELRVRARSVRERERETGGTVSEARARTCVAFEPSTSSAFSDLDAPNTKRSASRIELTFESYETFFASRRLIAAALPSPACGCAPSRPPGPPASLSRKL